MSKIKQVTFDRLVVVNSWGEGDDGDDSLAESAKLWRHDNEGNLFIASNCAHRLWIGSEDVFADFPEDGTKNLSLMKGREAYLFMLRMLSGIDSPQMCDTHVRSQLKDKWRAFKEMNREVSLQLETIYGYMMKDSGYVSDAILSEYKELKHEHAARDISGQVKGDKVLIVADLNRHGNIAQYTERMMRLSENKQGRIDDFLTITHPDPDVLKKIESEVQALQSGKKVKSNITFMTFSPENLAKAFEQNNRVYVDTAMDADMDADTAIIEAWKNRVRRDNTITHLRGNPYARGLSSDAWQEAELDNYFSPEDIRAEMVDRKKSNPAVILRAEAAIEVFADIRSEGRAPRKRMLAARSPEIFAPSALHLA